MYRITSHFIFRWNKAWCHSPSRSSLLGSWPTFHRAGSTAYGLSIFLACLFINVVSTSASPPLRSIATTVALANTAIAQAPEAQPKLRPAAVAQPPRYRYWTTHWTFDDINVGNVLGRLRRIGIEIPVNAQGDVSLQFSVSVPLNALRTAEAYRISGTLESKQLQLEQLQLANFSTDVRYETGELSLHNLNTQWIDAQRPSSGGILAGEASLALVPRGDLITSLTASRLSLGPVHDLILTVNRAADESPGGTAQAASQSPNSQLLTGLLSGSIATRVPLDDLSQLLSWRVDADLTAENLRFHDAIPLTIQTGPINIQQGQLSAPQVVAGSSTDRDIQLTASVQADLKQDRPFDFTIRANDLPLPSITRLITMRNDAVVIGKLDLDARGTGTLGDQGLENAKWNLNGRIASPELSVYGIALGLIQHRFEFNDSQLTLEPLEPAMAANESTDSPGTQVLLRRLQASYQWNEASFALNEITASAFGGTIAGSASLARTTPGKHELDLRWTDLTPRFSTQFLMPGNVTVQARTSGGVRWSMPAGDLDRPAMHDGEASISIDQWLVGRENLGNASLDLQAHQGQWQLNGEGNLFGGRFTVATASQLTADASWLELLPAVIPLTSTPTANGTARFHSVNLSQIDQLFSISSRQIAGTVSGVAEWRQANRREAEATPKTQALLTFDNLVVDRQLLARRIDGDFEIDSNGIRIRSLRGNYAGGQVDASGSLGFRAGTGRLQVRLAAIDAGKGLMLISPQSSNWVSGRLSGSLSIDSGATYRARGRLTLRQSKNASFASTETHASLIANVPRDLSRWELTLNSIESNLGLGRVTGNATLRSSSVPGGFDLASDWQARRLDFGRLLDDLADGSSQYTRGNLNGRLVLGGTGIRSVNDLTGRFSGELDGSQGQSIPGLDSAQAYLGAFSLADTRFAEGGIRGTILRGMVNVEDFWLMSNRMQVVANGRVALASRYSDIDAVISTGNFDVANFALLSLAEPLALDVAWPIGLVVRANQLLSNRTLYVQLVGPISDPRIRLKPLDTLRQGARRFLVREAISSVAPFAITGGSLLTNDR